MLHVYITLSVITIPAEAADAEFADRRNYYCVVYIGARGVDMRSYGYQLGLTESPPTPPTIIRCPYQLNKQVEQSGEFISLSECLPVFEHYLDDPRGSNANCEGKTIAACAGTPLTGSPVLRATTFGSSKRLQMNGYSVRTSLEVDTVCFDVYLHLQLHLLYNDKKYYIGLQ